MNFFAVESFYYQEKLIYFLGWLDKSIEDQLPLMSIYLNSEKVNIKSTELLLRDDLVEHPNLVGFRLTVDFFEILKKTKGENSIDFKIGGYSINGNNTYELYEFLNISEEYFIKNIQQPHTRFQNYEKLFLGAILFYRQNPKNLRAAVVMLYQILKGRYSLKEFEFNYDSIVYLLNDVNLFHTRWSLSLLQACMVYEIANHNLPNNFKYFEKFFFENLLAFKTLPDNSTNLSNILFLISIVEKKDLDFVNNSINICSEALKNHITLKSIESNSQLDEIINTINIYKCLNSIKYCMLSKSDLVIPCIEFVTHNIKLCIEELKARYLISPK